MPYVADRKYAEQSEVVGNGQCVTRLVANGFIVFDQWTGSSSQQHTIYFGMRKGTKAIKMAESYSVVL